MSLIAEVTRGFFDISFCEIVPPNVTSCIIPRPGRYLLLNNWWTGERNHCCGPYGRTVASTVHQQLLFSEVLHSHHCMSVCQPTLTLVTTSPVPRCLEVNTGQRCNVPRDVVSPQSNDTSNKWDLKNLFYYIYFWITFL